MNYPPVYELLYGSHELERLRPLPERSRQIVYYLDKVEGRAKEEEEEEVVDLGQGIKRLPR